MAAAIALLNYLIDCITGAGWTSDYLDTIPTTAAAYWEHVGHAIALAFWFF